MTELCLLTFSMIFPSGDLIVVRLEKLGPTRTPIPRIRPALTAKARHFRTIVQISIAVGKTVDVDGSSMAGRPQPVGGHFTSVKKDIRGQPAGSRTAVARLACFSMPGSGRKMMCRKPIVRLWQLDQSATASGARVRVESNHDGDSPRNSDS